MKKKVVVGMSGGVDSSVAAVLLKRAGYEVIGITMKTWDYDMAGAPKSNKETGCCSLESINDARHVAVSNDFSHYTMDFREDFGETVINYFKSEYLNGRTPNPCVMCNTKVKWEVLLERAKRLGADFMATGHYAKTRFVDGRHLLSKGKDLNKDQSYALWGISQEALSKTLFPLENLTKPEVRQLAREFGLKTAEKGESYEICFIPDMNYERFLKDAMPDLEAKVSGGNVLDEFGNQIGKHKGYPFYTIGQRKGFVVQSREPKYVTEIRQQENVIVVGSEEKLLHIGLVAGQVNWIASPIEGEFKAQAKIRYKDSAEACKVKSEAGKIQVTFEQSKRAITPGQSVVVYDGDDVLLGGIIERVQPLVS